MPLRGRNSVIALRSALRQIIAGPQLLAFLPAAVLAAFWLGGELALILIAIGLPVCFAVIGAFSPGILPMVARGKKEPETGLDALTGHLDTVLGEATRKSCKTACLCIELDDFDEISDRYGQAAACSVADRCLERLKTAMRTPDHAFDLGNGRFAVVIAPVRRLTLEDCFQIAARLQSAANEPILLDAATIYVSVGIGTVMNTQVDGGSGRDLANAAMAALRDARRHGPSAVRAYTADAPPTRVASGALADDVLNALENGQIQPWFQPQLSTDTGQVTGFEALARWVHPDRGLISPPEFLPALEAVSGMERLGEVMLYHALNALKSWDLQGLNIPRVGVNFASQELRNPRLVKKIEWELDRFNLPAERLVVEILETVVAASPDDTVARNIAGLSALGCQIDLDDFGTGHASISSIRRFAIQRLKIDRSFVMKVDQDPEQQRMVAAILMMAEQLGLDTLAEGVETAGEHAMLAQLGCGHVQGFGISRPLPFDQTARWVAEHLEKLDVPFVAGRKIG